MSPTLHLAPANVTLSPSFEPNLLPVNIPWDSPAPVSQYFLVKPAPEVETSFPVSDSENGETLRPKKAPKKRFLSAFRGRKMHGLQVPLPEGTTGLILRPADSESKERIERNIRRRRKQVNVDEEDDTVDLKGDSSYLEPIAKFVSFIHWNPDVPVDETRDEYIQALTQWRTICSKIHEIEESDAPLTSS